MNYDLLIANITRNKFGEEETLVKLPSNFYFYYTYIEDEKMKIQTGEPSIKVSWLSYIEPEWLVPTYPIFFSPVFNDVIMRVTSKDETFIEYLNSDTFKKLSKKVINGWNQNQNIWDSDKTPILRDFYRTVTKVLSYYDK